MARPLDFRFLDEGLGGQSRKRKMRDEEEQGGGVEDMVVEHVQGDNEGEGGTPAADISAGFASKGVGGLGDSELLLGSGNPESRVGGAGNPKSRRVEDARTVNAGKASGRKWKEPRLHRASTMRNAAGLVRVRTREERERQRQVDKAFRERKEELKEEIRQAKRAKRERVEEQKRKKEESALKGAKLQVISNARTLKKMSKKQLKQLVRIPG